MKTTNYITLLSSNKDAETVGFICLKINRAAKAKQ